MACYRVALALPLSLPFSQLSLVSFDSEFTPETVNSLAYHAGLLAQGIGQLQGKATQNNAYIQSFPTILTPLAPLTTIIVCRYVCYS
jgi:hypothetical protein